MYTYYDPYTTLYHFGIKGQKWGIRRYQNYDGTYTQKGLTRYNRSQEEYEKAKASGDKKATKAAKKQMNADYKRLKTDYMADEGKKLASEGKTISSEYTKAIGQGMAIGTGTYIATAAIKNGKQFTLTTKSGKNINLNNLAATTLNVGANAVAGILNYRSSKNIRNLRAYYNHRAGRK